MNEKPRKRRRQRRRPQLLPDRVSVEAIQLDAVASDDDHAPRLAESVSVAGPTRRGFIKGGGLMLAGGALVGDANAAETSPAARNLPGLRVGLVGCGARGTSHALELLDLGAMDGSIRLVAMADVFEHQLQTSYRTIRGRSKWGVNVDDRRYTGANATERLLAEDIDLVILASPTAFRAAHFRGAVEGGKHCLVESPLATDVSSIESFTQSSRIANEANLTIVAGLQRTHRVEFLQAVDRIRDGLIGDLLYARMYFHQRVRGFSEKRSSTGDPNFKIRNWRHYRQFVGDPSDEPVIEALAMLHRIVKAVPVEARGQSAAVADPTPGALSHGSHQGDVPAFRSTEYVYPNGLRLFTQTSSQDDQHLSNGFFLHGTKGSCDLMTGVIRQPNGKIRWRPDPPTPQSISQTPAERLLNSLKSKQPRNEIEELVSINQATIKCRNG